MSKVKSYSMVSGGTFRKRISREELQEFESITGDGSFWVGTGNRVTKMKVEALETEIELLIANTSNFKKGDYEYKVTALTAEGDTIVLVYGRIRVIG
ncbi:hypothetical protein [Aeromonas sp. AE23HZ002T15]